MGWALKSSELLFLSQAFAPHRDRKGNSREKLYLMKVTNYVRAFVNSSTTLSGEIDPSTQSLSTRITSNLRQITSSSCHWGKRDLFLREPARFYQRFNENAGPRNTLFLSTTKRGRKKKIRNYRVKEQKQFHFRTLSLSLSSVSRNMTIWTISIIHIPVKPVPFPATQKERAKGKRLFRQNSLSL